MSPVKRCADPSEVALLGVDVGGTSVKIGMCTGAGEVFSQVSIPTHAQRGVEDTVARIADAAAALQADSRPAAACGTGIGGLLDAARTILFRGANLPNWLDVPLPSLVADALGLPTVLENDANCAAWAEYRLGVGRGAESMVLLTLGTGVGGAIVLHDDLWLGHGGAAGRFGHTPVDPSGPACRCGQRGCLEQYASASAVAHRYGRRSAKVVFEAARNGDSLALQVIDWSSAALAAGVANVVQAIQPEIVVLGGGMAAGGDLLLERVRDGVRARIPESWWPDLRIEMAALGNKAGWIGAALWAARKLELPHPSAH